MRHNKILQVAQFLLVVSTVGAIAWAADEPAPDEDAKTIRFLRVVDEIDNAYQRTKFGGWVDDDGNCRRTQSEVLARESQVPTNKDCTVGIGQWQDPLEGPIMKTQGEVTVEPLVPFEEAWRSGAYRWGRERRFSYTNYLGNRHHLLTLSPETVGARGGRDPTGWLPTYNACWYIQSWVLVKSEWDLAVDEAEGRFLRKKLVECEAPLAIEFGGMPGEEVEVQEEVETKKFKKEEVDPSADCCIVCKELKEKACGDQCLPASQICTEKKGCACESWQIGGFGDLF